MDALNKSIKAFGLIQFFQHLGSNRGENQVLGRFSALSIGYHPPSSFPGLSGEYSELTNFLKQIDLCYG